MKDKNSGSGGTQEKVIIVDPILKTREKASTTSQQKQDSANEIEGLARAIDLIVVTTHSLSLSRLYPATLMGKGAVEIIGLDIQEHEPNLVIINHILSPIQQRNLEREWKAKVIDRTGLILEIFGKRAETREGRIQVDLAALEYQKSRLVRSWTHLERQRGGAGFMGGPGETQIEMDRRIITNRIASLKKDLEAVRKTRDLGRKSRAKVPFPVVAMVGYTNAGKSTLFNHLTGADVYAEDLLFATLDPTMRKLVLPCGRYVILSDTVGFIADLPTMLVAAFRATLEQVQYADMIIHVRDVSKPDHEIQRQNVIEILQDLDIDYHNDERVFEALNKVDLCSEEERDDINRIAKADERLIPVSALTGTGCDVLLSKISAFLGRHNHVRCYDVRADDGKALSWLHDHTHILEQTVLDDTIRMKLSIGVTEQGQFENQFRYSPEKQEKV